MFRCIVRCCGVAGATVVLPLHMASAHGEIVAGGIALGYTALSIGAIHHLS